MSAQNSTPARGFVTARNFYLKSRKKTTIVSHLMASVNAILAKLQSGKIRDATEGLNELRNVFSSKQLINNFSLEEDRDGNLAEDRMVWLAVYQALFEAAKFGLQVYEKKSKTGTKSLNAKVLEQVASTIRWLVERTVTKINSKISKALFNHLLQRMVYKGELLQPVALDYIKTLKVLVSCQPHMERMNAKIWLVILDTGFNCVLGDPILTSLDSESSFLAGVKELQDRLGGGVDDAMYEDDDEDLLLATPSTKKRRRRDSNEAMPSRATPTPFFTPRTLRRTGSIQAKPEQLEFASVIAIVLQHPVIPLPSSILVRLSRFLIVYPGDTSMNDDFLSALSATLSHLALNKIKDVEDFAKTVWYQLLGLWTSKNKRIKEVLVGILRVLFPYVTLDNQEQSLGELGFDSADGIGKLYEVLKAEVENRSGVEPLSLDTLRLEIGSAYDEANQGSGHSVLVAKTFRSGRDFDAPHALSWAMLELQADCAAKLFMLSESMSIPPATPSGPSTSKRKKRENPISELLSSMTTPTSPTARIYHLQILLFFIDRHWSILHDTIRREVFRCLMQGLSIDDGPIQSWTLLCLASLADNELSCNDTRIKRVDSSLSMSSVSNERSYDWDSLWTHSIRRANLPTVCRAACHTAYTLLRHWDTRSSVASTTATATTAAGGVGNDSTKRFLSTHKVLNEIEILAKDLDVQGPSYPYDSVCALLSQCLCVASQDVRLFRMQLEDKVLNWLMESWRGIGHEQQHAQGYGYGHGRDKMASGRGSSNTLLDVGSVLGLLEYVCGFGKRNQIVARTVLPDCHIVNAMKQENLTGVIRDFVLSSRLTPFNPRGGSTKGIQGGMRASTTVESSSSTGSGESTLDTPISERPVEALPPRPRERRISAFLVKSTESLISHCDGLKQTDTLPTAESARAYLDMAIIGLSFEALLEINGFQTTRRVVQNASQLIEVVTSWLLRPRWTLPEKSLVLHGLDPLTVISDCSDDESGREVLLKPESGMGIRLGVFRQSVDVGNSKACLDHDAWRIEFLKAIWKNTDTLGDFQTVANTLHSLALELLGLEESAHKMAIDIDRDSSLSQKTPLSALLLEMCVAFLAVGPSMSSSSTAISSGASITTPNPTLSGSTQSYSYHTQSIEPRRNKQLNSLVIQCTQGEDVSSFLYLYPLFLKQVRQQTVKIVPSFANEVLEWAVVFLKAFDYSRHQAFYEVLVDTLQATMESWILNPYPEAQGSGADPKRDLHNKMVEWSRDFIELISSLLRKGLLTSWKLRVKVAGFFDRLLSMSVEIAALDEAGGPGTWVDIELLRNILMDMGSDEDIRVRFRAALTNAKILVSHSGSPTDELYAAMLSRQGRKVEGDEPKVEANLDDVEHMISRIVALGNIMVVSAAVRRAAYWKLLEICMHTNQYSNHVYAVLTAVAERMGLSSLSTLSECYGTQLAWSIQLSRNVFPEIDFTRFKPSLLGYPNRTSCAMALFSSFTPVNLLFQNGRASFEAHCKLLQKSTKVGILECFGDIVGYSAVIALQDVDNAGSAAEELVGMVLEKTKLSAGLFSTLIVERSDAVSVAILRALSDQDVSSEGPIVASLQSLPESVAVWKALTYYRKHDKFRTHSPHLPAFPAAAVLRGLEWLNARSTNWNDNSTSYHVMHELFAEIHRSPLVNEQIRLINGLSLWISLHYRNFTDDTLVHTLVHGATSLLSQVDLVRSAQSLLEWGFSCYSELQSKDVRLPDVLIRICGIIHDYGASLYDHQLGKELESWIDEQTYLLSKSKHMRSEIASALLAWPHPPSANLMKLTRPTDSASSFLNNQRIVSNKFRLVRRLKEDVTLGGYDAEQWAKSDFWRLKDCMPSMEQMQTEDAHAFATLMILNRGFIDTNGQDVSPALTQTRARHAVKGRFKYGEQAPPRDCTILALLNILEENDPVRAYAAYQTLRMIMSVPAMPVETPTHWESAHKKELGLLEQFPRIPRPQAERNLHDLTNEKFLQAARNFKQWVALVTSLLSEVLSANDLFYAQLTTILGSDAAFAEDIFPILLQTLLQSVESDDNALYITQTLLSDYFAKVLSFEQTDVLCLRSIIDTVLHLRTCKRKQEPPDPLGHDKWLSIDYNLLAQSAILYGAYTTALLFLELAAEYSPSQPGIPAAESVLYEIYGHIDEPDGFYGIRTQDLHNFLLKRFHHEKQWEKAFRFHGAGLEAGSNQATEATGLLQAFHSFGFDHLAMENLQTSSSVSIQSSDMSYRLGWRTETWDLPDTSEDSNGAALYLAIRAIYRERNSRKVDQVAHASLLQSMHRLRSLGTENLAEIREVAQDIMCLSQVIQFRDPRFQESIVQKEPNINAWTSLINLDGGFEFSALENIMATRISLVRSLQQREKRQQIGNMATPFGKVLTDVEKQCLLKLSVAARHAGQVQIALNSIIRARGLEVEHSLDVAQEFACVLWLQKEEKLAVQHLKDLLGNVDKMEGSVDAIQEAMLYTRLGAWTSQACLEKPTDIWTNYFKRAISKLMDQGSKELQEQASVYHECAKFAERQYHAISNSPDVLRWKLYAERKKKEIQEREQLIRSINDRSKTSHLSRDQDKAQKLLQEDTESFSKHTAARDEFLREAINMYSRALAASDCFDDDSPLRLCSLWFANFDDAKLQDRIGVALDRIASRKLIFLAHQLSARLLKPPQGELSKQQAHLHRMIVRMCKEHPFHSLYQVFSIKAETTGARQSSRVATASAAHKDRYAAAEAVFERLRNDPQSRETITHVETLCKACVEWAKHPIKDNKLYSGRPPFHVPDSLKIRKILNLKVPVITHHTPIDPTMRYDNCVWIKNYQTTFRTAGGVNLPKISVCLGSDGEKYTQLFKGEGNDDMRQDAVMEQVFELVNRVLRKDRETKRRELKVRDYKVIPLGTQAGLLEFVGNTLPMQSWLSLAHGRYQPQGTPIKEVRERFRRNQAEYHNREELARSFIKLKENFKPVMRHYFTEKHKSPIAWFTMRLNYTRSVATTSIVGYMVGLGDRHISNILLDEVSGEVVHIDLGIAFDQGKLLPIPELVPFRMTADMVDGMGTSGTQGVFQRCAEETLRVLREGSEVLMTVLEVFKYDPLHSWTASELKVKRIQQTTSNESIQTDVSRFGFGAAIGIDMSSGTAAEAADRALSGVARKLDKALSVEYTVNELISEATDPMNLACIFYGWSPFC